MSPMTRLLLDRTLGMIYGMKAEHYDPAQFVAVMPQLVGSQVKAWVMLSWREFIDAFGQPSSGTQLQ